MMVADTGIDAVLERTLAAAYERDGGIGFVGTDLPVELFCASARPFGHLPWRTTGQSTWADRWLESGFPGWARSILQQWHEGAFDALDVVVFSRADDASQRLYYYVVELQRCKRLAGPRAHILDIALLPRDSSIEHSAAAIRALARLLDLERDDLQAGIVRVNGLRGRLDQIESQRTGHGPLFERLGRAALWSDPTQWIDSIDLPAAPARVPRVLLAGSVPPDERIHVALETAGCSVVSEAHVHGLRRLGDPVAEDSDQPERTLAAHLQRSSTGPRASLDRAAWICARAKAVRADAAVLWLTREDEALAWHVPSQRRALHEADVPVLVLPATSWLTDAQTHEKISDFMRNAKHATT